ncbi:CPCC family cysteine-rich protein [Streptomyces sp. NPDC004227]
MATQFGRGDGSRQPPAACGSMEQPGDSVCFWEDDGQDDHDADRVRGGPNGRLSLTEARKNFHAMGACDERCTQFVRAPLPNEHPTV